ncbi:MAG: UDP-N-acetylmuramate--L-alanine ligase, partial [Clostridia bacterium]|nr:UDP-N-acetylmuramate--L-alanine ligase [Clostridia bacterium]
MAASLDEAKRIHLIGIGGCSMSGIARILKAQGHTVSGSDRGHTQFTDRVEEDGITVYYGHSAEQAKDADLIIYSAAIKPDNPERAYGREHGIPELERSVALGLLSARFHEVVAVAGCHGKTTITSMLAFVNEAANLDATVHVGGFMDLLGGGVRLGRSDLFITEACEYVESFLTLKPTVAIINNIDNDHLDYYGDIEHIIDAFRRFIALVPETGKVLCCTDDAYV